MLLSRTTFTPLGVLRNPRGILETISRPLAILSTPRRFPLTLCKREDKNKKRRKLEGDGRVFSSSRITMASDADYTAFLNKAQKDYSDGASKQATAGERGGASIAQAEVHPAIRALGERYFVSDADEPFESVSFVWGKSTLPSEGLWSLYP